MQVCFIGHRKIAITEELILSLRSTILTLIQKGYSTFLFGSKSQFDNLSWEIVTDVKKTHPYIKRVYVRSSFQHIDKHYEKYLQEYYEESYFPTQIENAGKYSYVERNYEMINKSSCCIFYFDKNYITKNHKSGTKIAYEYAIKRKKEIINLF